MSAATATMNKRGQRAEAGASVGDLPDGNAIYRELVQACAAGSTPSDWTAQLFASGRTVERLKADIAVFKTREQALRDLATAEGMGAEVSALAQARHAAQADFEQFEREATRQIDERRKQFVQACNAANAAAAKRDALRSRATATLRETAAPGLHSELAAVVEQLGGPLLADAERAALESKRADLELQRLDPAAMRYASAAGQAA